MRVRFVAVLIVVLVATAFLPAHADTNDRYFADLWGIHKIDAPGAWATSAGKGVLVAVIDTGIDFTHPDLEAQFAGTFTCMGGTCREHRKDGDPVNHGTHVGGTIAASTGNGLGVASVAPEARLLSIQVAVTRSWDGRALGPAIRLAADRGAKVMNMSLGSGISATQTVNFGDDILYACDRGALIVASSGNDDQMVLSSYAAAPEHCLLVVGATGPNDERSFYTSGTESVVDIDVFAPGGNPTSGGCDFTNCILSTVPGGNYAAFSGTSMAAPHVSGVAALLRCQGHSNGETVSIIKSTADRTKAGSRVNAQKAVSARPGGSCGATYPGAEEVQGGQVGGTGTARKGPSARTGAGGGTTQTEGTQTGEQEQGGDTGLGDYQDPEAGSLLASEEQKKGPSTRTLINIGIAVALGAAGIVWYLFLRRRGTAEE